MQNQYHNEKMVDIPDAILGNYLGAAKELPEYAAAKSGSMQAAKQVAKALVNQDLLDKIKLAAGNAAPIIQPVYAVEATGENVIPQAAAIEISNALGLDIGTTIVQSNSPKRTSMQGLERIFNRPTFFGHVVPGRSYIILDDTLTQGGTFASLEKHIVEGGGKVIGAVALTGKTYSSSLKITEATLSKLRAAHGDIEEKFKAETGRGFGALTESEARYLANYKPAQEVRERIILRKSSQHAPDASKPHQGLDKTKIEHLSQETASAIGSRVMSSLMGQDKRNCPGPKPK